MKGLVASIDYSDYTYEDITLDGEYKQGGFNGNVSLNDENGAIQLNGSINTAGKTPTFNFRAAIDHFRPNTPAPHTQIQGHGIGRKNKSRLHR